MLATLRACENGISTFTTTAPAVLPRRSVDGIGTALRTTSPLPTSSTRQPASPRIAARTRSGSGLEKLAAGISGLIPLTRSSPSGPNTSTTPRLYSRCFFCTRSSSSACAPSRNRRPAAMLSAIRAP